MTTEFHVYNRKQLMEKLGGGLVVLSAYSRLQRGNDAASTFEQEANFWYVSGIEHADWTIVIDSVAESVWLIAPKVDAAHELFDGSLDSKTASAVSGIKKIVPHDEGELLLRNLAKKHSMVYTIDQPAHADHFNFICNPAIRANKRRLERIFVSVRDCEKELSALRAIKQPEEITAIKKATTLTVQAFELIKSRMDSYRYEYEIEADFSHFFRSRGATGHAYDPIIAAGKNACTLHYGSNASKLKSGQLVLMDVGVRYLGYTADITRTFAKGTVTKRQRAVFEAVRDAQEKIIALLAPSLAVESYQMQVDDIMKHALAELGLIAGESDENYRKYFPHAVSHGLGIDVHDPLGAPRVFASGMVLTVEPGIYIPEEGIGVRLEDDILITDTGRQNLTRKLSTAL